MIAAIVKQEGRHGFDVVAFDTEEQAREWAAANGLRDTFYKRLWRPKDWTPKGDALDDEEDA